MIETVFTRHGWLPFVIDDDGELLLEVVGGADPLHEPRTFTVPVRAEHLEALRGSLRRHVLLYAAMLPLCDGAGSMGPWDEAAAAAMLDPILLGAPHEVDAILRELRVDRRTLVAHRASVPLLKRWRYFEAAQSVTVTSDWSRARKYQGI